MSETSNTYNQLLSKLDDFIRRYYTNQLIKGGIYSLALLLSYFLGIVLIDYFGEFETTLRALLFYSWVLISTITIIKFLIIPGAKLFKLGKGLSYNEAAKIIGNHFSSVQDKLLNVLQLKQLSSTTDSALLYAGIDQKVSELKPVSFSAAIDFSENKKYVKYILPPVIVFLLLLFTAPNILKTGTKRLVNYNQQFDPIAPFQFKIEKNPLEAIKGEDFTIKINIEGNELPNAAYIEFNENRFLLKKESKSTFSFTIKSIQENTDFSLSANGFVSKTFHITVKPKPVLLSFSAKVNYPNYTQKENKTFNNTGDLVVPQGTKIQWNFKTKDAENLSLNFSDTVFVLHQNGENKFQFEHQVLKSKTYSVLVSNEHTKSKDSVLFSINVVPDQYPTIEVEEKADSLSEKRIYFRGNIADDYGLTKLTFNYRFLGNDTLAPTELISDEILVNKNTKDAFFHYWDISSLPVKAGSRLEYYFEVWDNDGINGNKSTKSSKKIFKAPTLEELSEKTDKSSEKIKEKMEESLAEAKAIQDELKDFQKKLLEKKQLTWDDKKQLEELLNKQKQLEKNIEKTKQENLKMQNEQNDYQEQEERILEKQQQIQELFDQVMTEEMKEMFRELEEMMENIDKEELQEKLNEMQLTNKDIEKELDRTLETFKQMEFEMKLEETIDKLDELAKEQKELANDTKEKKLDNEELNKKQEEIKEKFENLQKEMEELSEKNEELENKHDIPDTQQEQQEAKNKMEESSEQLQNKKNKKASESQKSAGDEMQKMADKLQSLQQEMQEQQAEDLDALRQLRDNLIQLSFDQEELLKEVKTVKGHSPYYVKLIQRQKKISDDAKMIEDSLFALSKRQPTIQSVVNREMTQINENIEKTIDLLTNHNPPKRFNQYITEAAGREQYVMTSLNNLALMLDESIQQMQQQMSQQKFGDKSCSKPGSSSQPKPGNMKKMQESLSKQLEQMKKEMENGKKPGKKPNGSSPGGMSKKLAELAAQQEALRNEVQKMAEKLGKEGEEKGGGGDKGNLEKLAKLMEENEKDIVNKSITQETIKRQREILTRLLEHEKAEKEREYDNKRQSQEAKNYEISNPSEFFEYNTLKQKEVELLRTVPPTMNSFYKNKVNEYFNQVE